MPRYDFDMITIGAGSGGVACSRRAGAYGARVAIVEELRVGGTCVLRGCVPKKLLVYGAQFADAFADAAGFGWSVKPADFSWPALIAAKDKELDRLNQIYINMLNNAHVEIMDARGVVVDPHTVEVGGRAYTAENILIAVGGWPETPDIPGIEHVISSNEALDLPSLPKRVVIVGGGYIAVEFAGIFNGFGSEVVEIIRREEVLRGFDEDIRVYLGQEMKGRGIDIRGGTQVSHIEKTTARIEKTAGAYAVHTTDGGKIETDCVMYATGRKPNTTGMGLAEAGVELTRNGAVVVDEWQRSSVPSIYAVGDVTDRINLTPVAIAEGRAIAETLYNNNPMTMDHADVPSAVFSQPPVSVVGLNEEEARKRIRRGRHLPVALQADEEHAVGPRRAHLHEAGGRRQDRPGARLPHARGRRARDRPGPRGRDQMRRDQAAVRPDRRHPPERRRGVRHDARQIRAPGEGGGGVGAGPGWAVLAVGCPREHIRNCQRPRFSARMPPVRAARPDLFAFSAPAGRAERWVRPNPMAKSPSKIA